MKPIQTFKHPFKVHAVAGIAYDGKTDIFLFTKNLTADLYVEILEKTLIPCAQNIFGDSNWTLLHDNDPKHTSNKVKLFLDNNNINYINSSEWPSYSPDLNPIENIWSMLKQKVSERNPRNQKTLLKMIKEEWENIDVNIIKKAIDSMSLRLNDVIKNKGAKTKY